jgi:hypothetical protein
MGTEGETEDWPTSFSKRMAKAIESKLTIEGYSIVVKPTKTAIVYAIAKGAEGDTTAMRQGRAQLGPILQEIIDAEFKTLEGFTYTVSTSNKGDDLYFSCEIIFP